MLRPQASTSSRVRRRTIEGDKEKLSLSRRVEVVDDTRLEFKLNYGLPPGDRRVRYQVQLTFFFPGSLDVTPLTYPKHYFYSDLSAYVRLRSPELDIGELLDPENALSPLARLHALRADLEEPHWHRQIRLEEVAAESKLYGCLARIYVRDRSRELVQALSGFTEGAKEHALREQIRTRIRNMLAWVELLLEELRAVRTELAAVMGPEDHPGVEALDNVDEFLSYQIERIFCRLLESIEGVDEVLAEDVRGPMRKWLQGEIEHRTLRDFVPTPLGAEENDLFAHRHRLLKKYVSSALFLDQDHREPEKEYSDWIGALAAGVAMAFATLAYYFLRVGGLNKLDWWLLATIVVVYVFKDRLKDVVKRRMASGTWFPDLDTRILNRRFRVGLGRCREHTEWLETGQIPPLVEQIRSHQSRISRELRRATGETVLSYQKTIDLYPGKLRSYHGRHDGVTDIIRIGLDRLRRNMDLPEATMRALDPKDGQVHQLASHKDYVVNLVLRYQLQGQTPYYEKIRVVLDKEGLRRVETVIPMLEESAMQELTSASPGRTTVI